MSRTPEEIIKEGINSIPFLQSKVEKLEAEVSKLKKERKLDSKLIVSTIKDLTVLKKEFQRLNTRIIANENDIRYLSSKR